VIPPVIGDFSGFLTHPIMRDGFDREKPAGCILPIKSEAHLTKMSKIVTMHAGTLTCGRMEQ
jgi:hypothetical protein